MEAKESHKYQKWCNDNGIRIYPIPIHNNSSSYKICVETNSVPSIGKLIFEDKPKRKEPSIWDQIKIVYKIIYERKNLKNEATI